MDRKIRMADGLLPALLVLAGCALPSAPPRNLKQAAPHETSKSLRLPPGTEPGPVIPGLKQGAVPQGLSYWKERNLSLTSHYFDSKIPSSIVSTDWETGKALHVAELKEPGGRFHYGHAGGIAVESSNLWMASGAYLYRYPLESLVRDETVKAAARFNTEATTEVAFCAVQNGTVWAGEFAMAGKYPTDPCHHLSARDGTAHQGWVCGYDPEKGFATPERILSIPDQAQGMAITDRFIFLSFSFGHRNNGTIGIYRNPLSQPPHRTVQTSEGDRIPLWFLDGENRVRSIGLPPMAENIAIIDGKLAVLFESAAEKYKWFGKRTTNRILLLDVEELGP